MDSEILRFNVFGLFLLVYVKSFVSNKPAPLEQVETNINRAIVGIQPDLLRKVFRNWTQ